MAETKYKVLKTTNTEIWLDEEGILHLKGADNCIIDLEEVMECFSIYRDMGLKNNRVLQLIDARNHFSMAKEGRDYAAIHGKDYFIASAIVSDHLAVRLMVNFFNRFYKHKVPFKIFNTHAEAFSWLRKFKKN